MKSVRVLSHTADVRLLIRANSRHELFTAGLLGIARMMSPEIKNKDYTFKRTVEVESGDLTGLFIDFLNEILSFNNIDKCIYDLVKDIRITDNAKIIARIEGYGIPHFKKDIKAVTYHEAEIRRSGVGLYEATIILDI
jgi:SHS2 domain-containing protein